MDRLPPLFGINVSPRESQTTKAFEIAEHVDRLYLLGDWELRPLVLVDNVVTPLMVCVENMIAQGAGNMLDKLLHQFKYQMDVACGSDQVLTRLLKIAQSLRM